MSLHRFCVITLTWFLVCKHEVREPTYDGTERLQWISKQCQSILNAGKPKHHKGDSERQEVNSSLKSFSIQEVQGTCAINWFVYNEMSTQAYQMQPRNRDMCCIAPQSPQRPAYGILFFAGRCPANFGIWHHAWLSRKDYLQLWWACMLGIPQYNHGHHCFNMSESNFNSCTQDAE